MRAKTNIGILVEAIANGECKHMKGFFPRAEQLLGWAENGISMFSKGETPPKLRVFHDFGQRTDFLSKLILSPKRPTEQVPEWISRVLEINEFCLVVNGISAWSPQLHDFVYDNFVVPVIARFGEPLKPFDVYMFCGNYALTPFGVHSDAEDSILLHLGPGSKRAFVWPPEIYKSHITGNKAQVNLFDFERLKDVAMDILLEPGDVLVIPRRVPHVMVNGAFSVTLGFIPNPVSSGQALLAYAREVGERVKSNNYSFVSKGDLEHAGVFRFACRSFSKTALRQAGARIMARNRSNGFLTPAPKLPGRDNGGSSLRMVQRYPVQYCIEDNVLIVFVRGRELQIPFHSALLQALDYVISGDVFDVGDFIKAVDSVFEPDAALAILRKIRILGGLEVA